MGSNTLGGRQAAKTCKKRYGKDFHSRIGREGGKAATGIKGFALMSEERRREVGRLGGSRSSRAGIMKGMGKRRKK